MTLARPHARVIVSSQLLLAHAFAVLKRTRRVTESVVTVHLDEFDGTDRVQVRHAFARVDELVSDRLDFAETERVGASAPARSTTLTTQRVERLVTTALIKPHAHLHRLGNVWVDFDICASDGAHVFALEFTDARILHRHDGFFTARDQCFNLSAQVDGVRRPESKLDGGARVVAEHNRALGRFASVALHDGGQIPDAVRDANNVDHLTARSVIQSANLLEIVLDPRDGFFRLGARHEGRVLVDFDFVLTDGEPWIARLRHLTLGNLVHGALTQLLRETNGGVAEAHALHLATVLVENLKTEHLALAARVGVRTQLQLTRDSSANSPSVLVRIQISDHAPCHRRLVASDGTTVATILTLRAAVDAAAVPAVPAAARLLLLLVMLLLLHRRGPVTTLRRTVPLYLCLWRASVRVSLLLLVTTALDTAHRRRRRRAPHPRLAHRRALLFHHRRLDDDDDPAFTNRDATAHIFSSVVRPSRARVVRPSCVVERDIPLARAREISRRGRAIRFDPP